MAPSASGWDPATAYLTQTETTSYPDLTGTFGAGWEAETQVLLTQWNKYTGAWSQTPSWSGTQANFNARAALGPSGVSGSIVVNTATEYKVNWINATTGEVFWTDDTVLSDPFTLDEANTLAANLLAAASTASVPWNETQVISLDSSGAPIYTYGGNGGGTGLLAAYLPLDVSNYPATPYSIPFAAPDGGGPYAPGASSYSVLAISDIYTNMSFWDEFEAAYTTDISDCNYRCVPAGSGMHLYSYDIPGAQGITEWLAYNTSYVPNSVPSPCDGSPAPTC